MACPKNSGSENDRLAQEMYSQNTPVPGRKMTFLDAGQLIVIPHNERIDITIHPMDIHQPEKWELHM